MASVVPLRGILKKQNSQPKPIARTGWYFTTGGDFYGYTILCNGVRISNSPSIWKKLSSSEKKKTNTPISEGQLQIKTIAGNTFLVFCIDGEVLQYKYIGAITRDMLMM
jgi:hypothetical protein